MDSSQVSDGSESAPVKFPNFAALGQIYAITSRQTGRLNASSISEQEHQDLLRERQLLLDKKLDRSITRKEENRLQYVRWSLDRIEDAKYGEALDRLEEFVARYERFEVGLSELRSQLTNQLPSSRKHVREAVKR